MRRLPVDSVLLLLNLNISHRSLMAGPFVGT